MSSASVWTNAYAYCVNPLQAVSSNPLCSGTSTRSDSIVLSEKGTASRMRSGSSSDAKLSPLAASVSASPLMASFLIEHPAPTEAASANASRRLLSRHATSDLTAERAPNASWRHRAAATGLTLPTAARSAAYGEQTYKHIHHSPELRLCLRGCSPSSCPTVHASSGRHTDPDPCRPCCPWLIRLVVVWTSQLARWTTLK